MERQPTTHADIEGILTVRAEWNMQSASCEVFSSDNHLLGGFYMYSVSLPLSLTMTPMLTPRAAQRSALTS